MKIRVLHVIDHLGYGGAPMVVKNIVERIDAEKIQTLVCTLRTNPRPLPVGASAKVYRQQPVGELPV